MSLPIYEIFIEDNLMNEEVLSVALVEDPAIGINFMKFNKEEEQLYKFNADKQIISGPVMIANKPIYRKDINANVFYSDETIDKAAALFIKNGSKFNIEHKGENFKLDIIEAFFSNDKDGNKMWNLTAHIKDTNLWNFVKEKTNGFSFQGAFTKQLIANFQKNNEEAMELKDRLITAINAVLFDEHKFAADSGTTTETTTEAPVTSTETTTVEPVTTTDTTEAPVTTTDTTTEPVAPELPDISIELPETITIEQVNQLLEEKLSGLNEQLLSLTAKLDEYGNRELTTTNNTTMLDTRSATINPSFDYLRGL